MPTCIFLFFAILFLGLKEGEEGCPQHINVTTSNGVKMNSGYRLFDHCDSVFVTGNDSISFFATGGNCCTPKIIKITLNGSNVPFLYKVQGSCIYQEARFIGSPGHYVVDITFENRQLYMPFDMIANTVSIKESSIENDQIQIYPNPCANRVNVFSKEINLKAIDTYDCTGKKIDSFNLTESTFEIPLDHYSPGLYYFHLTTLEGRSIIKKITVL